MPSAVDFDEMKRQMKSEMKSELRDEFKRELLGELRPIFESQGIQLPDIIPRMATQEERRSSFASTAAAGPQVGDRVMEERPPQHSMEPDTIDLLD